MALYPMLKRVAMNANVNRLLGVIRKALVSDGESFDFLDPGCLVDGDLELVLVECAPGNPLRDWAPAYRFEMRCTGTATILGEIDIRIGGGDNLVRYFGHIGYGVFAEHRGHGYAARSCKLLFPLARRHGFQMLWITCNPDNQASRRTCELIGGRLIDTVALPKSHELYMRGDRYKCRYLIDL